MSDTHPTILNNVMELIMAEFRPVKEKEKPDVEMTMPDLVYKASKFTGAEIPAVEMNALMKQNGFVAKFKMKGITANFYWQMKLNR